MRNIDFRTSHNIVLSYPLANPGQRILAYFIDSFITYLLFMFTIMIASDSEIIMLVFGTLFFSVYHLSFEVFAMGQTPGKMLTKIRVVALDGKTPSLKQYIIRWSYRLIDIALTLGTLGIFTIYSSPLGQRLGDLMAGTTVVSTRHLLYNNLKDLEKLNMTKREIKYPLVVQYTDEDMITVKKMLQRYRSNPNDDNGSLLLDLAHKISQDLNIANITGSKVDFLENVLSDYIILTR